MQSFILISKNQNNRAEYIQKFCIDHKISKFDLTIIKSESSIGIEEIREMQKTLFLKPFQGKEKIVVLENAQTLTIEAQNALLKALEEPPSNTYFFLSAESVEAFLPTILSRCKIINLFTPNPDLIGANSSNASIPSQTPNLTNLSISEKLKLAEDLSKDKNESLLWLEQDILDIREQILNSTVNSEPTNSEQFLILIKNLQEAYKTLSTTNVNPRFCLENLLLSI